LDVCEPARLRFKIAIGPTHSAHGEGVQARRRGRGDVSRAGRDSGTSGAAAFNPTLKNDPDHFVRD
jgi:hypothetical protein